MVKVGVILSGCGVFDGSEIHEAVCILLALDQRGAKIQCMAPNKSAAVVNHLAKSPGAGERNVLEESARIARGEVIDLAKVMVADYDAFIFPGGFGAAKNLCTFATEGENCSVDPHVAKLLQEAHQAGKPIGLACIAPVIAAKVFGKTVRPTVTIGHDKGTATKIEAMGAVHAAHDVDEIAIDKKNRIVTTPCYMEAQRISEIYVGADKLVEAVLAMVAHPASV